MIGGCERCHNPNAAAAEYRIRKQDKPAGTRVFCDDCARATAAIYELSPAPPAAPGSEPAPAAADIEAEAVEEAAPAAADDDPQPRPHTTRSSRRETDE